MGILLLGSAATLRFVSANGRGPTDVQSVAVASATTTRFLTRNYFIVGTGDVSQLILSFYAFYVQKAVGVTALNGYTIESVAIEYNGTSAPVTFSGGRSKVINAGDTDIQSDPLLPSAFGLSSFVRGSSGFVRLMLTFATPSTDQIANSGITLIGDTQRKYDPSKVSVTNGVDGTGAINYSMINGGVNGTDAVAIGSYMTPAVLGKYVAGDGAAWISIGDSKTYGTGDAATVQGVLGLSRAYFPDPTLAANAISNWNIGVNSGAAIEWAGGTPSLLTTYLKYFKYAIEAYGTNAANAAASQAIHAQLRTAGVQKILRTSLTPRTTSTDNWVTEVNQTTVSGWSPGGTIDIFEQAMQALVAADLTYIDTLAVRGSTHWLWIVTGAAFYSTADGLHQSSQGYELTVGGTSSIIAQSGTTSSTMRAVIAALP